MMLLPVIERELRAQARLGFTYGMRVIAAAALLGACVVFALARGLMPQIGAELFATLNCLLVVSLWILVPLLCADSISRERREGTIGLLFLTPLKAREIVLAKSLVHGIRAMTVFLAALPMMTICFLLGGVTWREAALCGMVNFCCICWALAAGILASSAAKQWVRSLLLTAGMAGCFSTAMILLHGIFLVASLGGDSGFHLPFPYSMWDWKRALEYNSSQVVLPVGFFAITDFDAWWGMTFGTLTHASQRAWLLAEAAMALFSILMLLGVVWVSAWNLRRTWQEEPPSTQRVWLEQKLAQPIIAPRFLHRWLRRKLERNPIGWLEQRTWSGRLVTWGWFAVMISFYTFAFTNSSVAHLRDAVQMMLSWMLTLIMAGTAAGSFQRERETKVLELLLVSPMTTSQIIWGRLRGLWGQFVAAFALLIVVWIYMAGVLWSGEMTLMPFFCGEFITLPVIGLYYSLKRKNFIAAFLWTLWTGVALPFVIAIIAHFTIEMLLFLFGGANYRDFAQPSRVVSFLVWLGAMLDHSWSVLIIQGAIAGHIGLRLHHNLENRTFAFAKGAE